MCCASWLPLLVLYCTICKFTQSVSFVDPHRGGVGGCRSVCVTFHCGRDGVGRGSIGAVAGNVRLRASCALDNSEISCSRSVHSNLIYASVPLLWHTGIMSCILSELCLQHAKPSRTTSNPYWVRFECLLSVHCMPTRKLPFLPAVMRFGVWIDWNMCTCCNKSLTLSFVLKTPNSINSV